MFASEKKDDQTVVPVFHLAQQQGFTLGMIVFYNSVTSKPKQLFTIPVKELIVQLVLTVGFPMRLFDLNVYWNSSSPHIISGTYIRSIAKNAGKTVGFLDQYRNYLARLSLQPLCGAKIRMLLSYLGGLEQPSLIILAVIMLRNILIWPCWR